MNPNYPAVAQRARHECEYCRAPEEIFNFPFEVEHIIPSNFGGSNELANLALACRSCNLRKSDHRDAIDPETRKTVTLFNPRKDVWAEHFAIDKGNARILGRTPIGRATVELLQMNGSSQVTARKFWIRLQLYSV